MLKALEMSTETAVLEGSRTMSVKPLAGGVDDGLATVGGLDAELEGLKDSASLIRDEFNGDLAGDAAKIGRRVPFGLRRAMMEAPQTNSPCRRRLTTSVMRCSWRSDEAGRMASRMWDGRSPERPPPEVEGKECTALRT